MTEKWRRDDYIKEMQDKWKKEARTNETIYTRNLKDGDGLTSPTSAVSTHETRILMEYMENKNLFHLTTTDETRRKILTLKKFFKMKRNQQVEIYSIDGDEKLYVEGKVAAVGRDFVMITNLHKRIWIPYDFIISANIPFGIPNYSNTHQHYLFDNDLRMKLVLNFGATVSEKEALIQQFFEESLRTNLETWRDTWVEVGKRIERKSFGKIIQVENSQLQIKRYYKDIETIPITNITYIETLRLLQILRKTIRTNESN